MSHEDERANSATSTSAKLVKETVILLVSAVLIALVVKTFLIQSFYIPSESMEPGLEVEDRILVQKPSYWFGEPQRGDVVVFADPGGWLAGGVVEPQSALTRTLARIGLYPTGGHLVKRVVGVGGDVIRCCDTEGRLQVNGEPVDESGYIAPGAPCAGPMVRPVCRRDWQAGPVPEGMLFVMGDNRTSSSDSSVHVCSGTDRCAADEGAPDDETHGYVPVDGVVGKVFVLAWPPGRAHFVRRPESFASVPEPTP